MSPIYKTQFCPSIGICVYTMYTNSYSVCVHIMCSN